MFSGEAKFCIFGIKERKVVWRKQGTAYEKKNLVFTDNTELPHRYQYDDDFETRILFTDYSAGSHELFDHLKHSAQYPGMQVICFSLTELHFSSEFSSDLGLE